ncbi:MAG: DUF1844 domain-containing protein [Thermoleophilia bacterium]
MNEDEEQPQESAAETAEDVTPAPAGDTETAESAGPDAEQMSESELRQKLEEHFREQQVGDVLVQFLVSLSTLAYMKMGLTEDSLPHKDFDQASLAIDSFKAVLDTATGRIPEQDAAALSGALASMQLTFAQTSAEPDTAK